MTNLNNNNNPNINVPTPPVEVGQGHDSKKRKTLVIFLSVLVVLILIVVAFLGNLNREEDVEEITVAQLATGIAWTEEEALFHANSILEMLYGQRDSFGLYTGSSNCMQVGANAECFPHVTEWALVEEFDPEIHIHYSAYRESLLVAWANFKYFEKTGDQVALRRMEDGIDALITHVIDSDMYILQTDRLGCALLRDIAMSSLISTEYRHKANYICIFSSMEFFHESRIWGTYIPTFDETSPHIPVVTERILQTLSNINDGQPIPSSDFDISSEWLPSMLSRHLYAVINSYYRNSLLSFHPGDVELNYAWNHLKALVALEETIQWYFTNYRDVTLADHCLMMGALDLYGGKIGFAGLNQELRVEFRNYAMQNENNGISDTLICGFMDYYTDNGDFDKGPIVDIARRGHISNNTLITFISAMMAGLLSI